MVGGGTPLIVNNNGGTFDKTWQEINDAIAQGRQALIASTSSMRDAHTLFPIVATEITPGVIPNYIVRYIGGSIDAVSFVEAKASSSDGYPSRSSGGGIH